MGRRMMTEQFSFLQIVAERRRIEAARVERVAEAMWQGESLLDFGRTRLISWDEEGPDMQEKWRGLARAGLMAAKLFDQGRLS